MERILWIGEKVDHDALERQFPLFHAQWCADTMEGDMEGDGVFRDWGIARGLRMKPECDDEFFGAEIRQTAAELECTSVVLDHESAPWPLVSWLAKNDFSENAENDANTDYDKPKYIPVFVHWNGRLYFISKLELEKEA